MNGLPQIIVANPPPTEEDIRLRGELPFLMPLPRFENSQPANILRIFERGGKGRAEVGIPNTLRASPGRPEIRLSERGPGHRQPDRPGLHRPGQKTRLLDPTLNFLGTNDHAGDYRSSGCTACHMMYANDRSPVHSGQYAKYGNQRDQLQRRPPRSRKTRPGHPIEHKSSSPPRRRASASPATPTPAPPS